MFIWRLPKLTRCLGAKDSAPYQRISSSIWSWRTGRLKIRLIGSYSPVFASRKRVNEHGLQGWIHSEMVLSQMWYIPPYTLLKQWMGRHVMAETARLRLLYDDVLDVLKELLQPIPVDEAWYKAEYPAVAEYLVRGMTETAKSHFQKHGYFEGRKPFAPGWRGLPEPTPFAQLQSRLRIIPSRGRLIVEIEHNDFLGIVSDLLTAVPVDQTWYRTAYPDVVKELDDGTSAVYHYARQGYFEDRMPFDITVDPEWYVSRYQHVRMALERGDARSAQDHFMRAGYIEGCRPRAP